jgi:uncharacterized membrane protein (UPF0127 family)
VSAPSSSSLDIVVERVSRDPGLAWLRRAVWLIFALGLVCFLVRGADRPRDPRLIPANASVPSATVRGFNEVSFTVGHPTSSTGVAHPTHCALLADTEARRNHGLMHRRDLGGYEAMVFEWGSLTADEFFMKDTLIPLTLAWFDAAGKFIGSADMTPCLAGSCRLYSAPSQYMIAIEVPQGSLSYFGIGSGSSISTGGPCSS